MDNKMFYQRWWFWLILAGFILGLIALLVPRNGTEGSTTATTAGSAGASATTAEKQDVVLLNSSYSMSDNNDYILGYEINAELVYVVLIALNALAWAVCFFVEFVV